jgi:hypothetical protein
MQNAKSQSDHASRWLRSALKTAQELNAPNQCTQIPKSGTRMPMLASFLEKWEESLGRGVSFECQASGFKFKNQLET